MVCILVVLVLSTELFSPKMKNDALCPLASLYERLGPDNCIVSLKKASYCC